MIHPFIWGKTYTPFECLSGRNPYSSRTSEAFYCAKCGEVWARLFNESYPHDWMFSRVDCDHCGPDQYGLRVPGSLILPWDKPLYASLPADLLRREVLLLAEHVKHFPNFTYL